MPKTIPMPPAPGQQAPQMPNPILQPTPFGPANTGGQMPPQPPDPSVGILAAHGASVRPDGSLKIRGMKEQPMGVVKIAQAMFQPNVISLPPVKPLNNPMLAMGTGPAMDNSGSWGSTPNKKAR